MQQGSFALRALPRFLATTSLAAAVSSSVDFPESPVIRPTCSTDFPMGRGRFLQLLSMSLSPCSPQPPPPSWQPARVSRGLVLLLCPGFGGLGFGVLFF